LAAICFFSEQANAIGLDEARPTNVESAIGLATKYVRKVSKSRP
jgi:hypothetical protein